MGYMTVVSILNDGWDTIKENPQTFIKNIDEGMEKNYKCVQDYPVSNFANPMEVHRSFHANTSQLLLVGGNHMENVSEFNDRKHTDFYLDYKMHVINEAFDKIQKARQEALALIADLILNNLHESDSILELANHFDCFKELSDTEQQTVISLIKAK